MIGRTKPPKAISSPASADRVTEGGRQTDGCRRYRSTTRAASMSSVARVSDMMECSRLSSRGSNSTGAAASVAPQLGTVRLISSAYTITAMARPIRCCRPAMSASESNGRISARKKAYPSGRTGSGVRWTASHM